MNTGLKNINLFLAFYKYKNLALAGLFVFIGLVIFSVTNEAFATTMGPYNPSNADSINIGQIWNDPAQIYSSNDSNATSTLDSYQTTDYLLADTFGFSIPSGATINGIEVSVEKVASNTDRAADGYLSLLYGGSPYGDNKADTGTSWCTTECITTYGGPTDTWGGSWTYSDINDSLFGIYLRVDSIAEKGVDVSVDNIQITVYYTAGAQTCQSITSGSGNWNSASSWTSCGGSVPGSADTAVINGTANITVTASTTVSALNFGTTSSAATAAVLTVNSGQALNVTNAITMNPVGGFTGTQGTIQNGTGSGTVTAGSIVIGASVSPSSGTTNNKLISTISTLTVSGGVTLNSYNNFTARNNPYLEIQSGTFSTSGITTSHSNAANTATVTLATGSQNGTLVLTGGTPWTLGSGNNTTTLNGTSSTVEYSGTSQTILNTTYTGLKVSGNAGTTAQTATVAGLLNVTGTMNPSSGTITLNNGASISNSGTLTFYNLTVASGATVTGNTSYTVAGTLTNSSTGTFTASSGTQTFNNGSSIVNSGSQLTFYNLTVATSATVTANTSYTVSNVLTVSGSATLSPTSGTITLSGSGTPLSVSGTFSPSGSNTVSYTGTSATNIRIGTYYNLDFSPASGTPTYTAGAGSLTINGSLTLGGAGAATVNFDTSDPTVDINGSLTIGSGDTLVPSASGTFTIAGSFTNSGSFNGPTNSTVTFDSSSTGNTINANAFYGGFYNIIFNNASGGWTVTGSALSVSGTLTITAGNLNGGSQTIILWNSGTPFVNNGTFTQSTSTIAYGASSANIAALNGSSTTNAYYNLSLGSLSEVGTSTYTLLGNTTVNNVVDIGVGANGVDTFALGSYTLTLKGSGTPITLTATYGAISAGTSTIQYTSASGITKLASTAPTGSNKFYNLTINGSGTFTAGVNYEVGGTLTVTSGTFNGTSYTATMNNGSVISNSGTLTFGNLTIAASATVTANTSYTVAGVLTVSSLANLSPSSGTITLSGTGTPLVNTGTFSASGTNIVQYTGSTANVSSATFAGLTLGNGGAGTYTMPATTLTLKGNLIVSNNATVTKGAGTIVFSGTGSQSITDSNATKQDLGAVQVSNTSDTWWNSGWLARRKITLDNSALSANLTSFPVLVTLTSAQIDYAKTKNDGQDIRFVDADGTTSLSYQIEKWDESGTSLVWVKVPTVSNNNTDYIWMYYDNPLAPDNQAPTSVWDSNHKAIYHMTNGSVFSGTDSTGVNTGNITSATTTSGKVGLGGSFNGTSSKIIAPASSSLDVSTGTGITVSGWFYPGDVGGMRPLIEWGNSGSFGVHMWNYPQSGNIYVNVVDSSGGNHTFQTSGSPLTASAWQHVGFTYNKSTGAVALYHNGTSQSISSSNIGAFTPKTNLDFNIGHRPYSGGQYYYSGSTDEVRVSDVVRSADWFKAEYNSANNTMNSFSSEEVYGSANGLLMGSSLKMTSLTIDSGKTFSANGSNTLTLTGNGSSVFVTTGATFIPSTGTVEFVSAATTGTSIPAINYYNLTVNKTSNTFTSLGETSITNTFTITAGTFVASSEESLLIRKDFVNNGTFNSNGGQVEFYPSATDKTIQITGSSGVSFTNLYMNTSGTIVRFQAGNSYAITSSLYVYSNPEEPTFLSSTSSGQQWTVTLPAITDLLNVKVRDSACSGGSTLQQSKVVFNGGNNGTCWGFPNYGVVTGGGSSGGGGGSSGSSGGGGGQSGGGGVTSSTMSAGTIADDSGIGDVSWTNPSNAQSSNNVYATASGLGLVSHYLKATNFGFAIPTGATINGIYVEVEKYSLNTVSDNTIKIVKANGTLGNTNKSTGATWPTPTEAYVGYGSSSDLWGETWTYADINDADFGVAIVANITGSGGSFHGEVLVSTPFGHRMIKDLKQGDYVWSYNDHLGVMEIKRVTGSWSFPIKVDNNRYFYIYANGKLTKTTENHRFYVNGDYIRADELKVGDMLTDFNFYTYPIEKIEIVSNTTDLVWDIEVEDNHNFYANGILVHNPPTATAYVDHMRITVYYTPAVEGGGSGGSSGGGGGQGGGGGGGAAP